MKRTTKAALAGASAFALATLLASPTLADSRSRSGSSHGNDRGSSHSSASSRSGGSSSQQRSDHSWSGHSSDSERHGSSAPWGFQQRQPESRGETHGTRPDFDARNRGPVPFRPTAPIEPGQRWRGQSDDRQRYDDRSDGRSMPWTQRPADPGRDRRQFDNSFDDRFRNRVGDSDRRDDGRGRSGSPFGSDRRQDGWRDGRRDGGGTFGRFDTQFSGHRTQQFSGRVSRFEHASGGYRVWISGSDHCFWIPEARFLFWPLRLGLSVTFGGFWNPAGYYNVYDYGPSFGVSYYGGSYPGYYSGYNSGSYPGYYGNPYPGGSYSGSSFLQGYVDRFDDDGTMVVRDDRSGGYVTVVIQGRDARFRYLQPGDWISLSGDWTRTGYFEAYRIEDLAQR